MFDRLRDRFRRKIDDELSPGKATADSPPTQAGSVPPIRLTESDLDDGDLPDEEPDRSLDASIHYADTLTNAHNSVWGLESCERWDADLDAGTLIWTNAKGWKIVAPVQIVGTFNSADGTWLWAWDHPSIPEPLRHDSELVRQFGEAHGLNAFTTRKIEAAEEDAWQFTALASYLAKSQGVYRGPSSMTMVFMSFGELTISQP